MLSLIPALRILVTADFIDTAMKIFSGEAARVEIYRPLVYFMLFIAYANLNNHLMNFVNLKLEMNLNRAYRSQIAEKRAKLSTGTSKTTTPGIL